jgi:hypothetical protein
LPNTSPLIVNNEISVYSGELKTETINVCMVKIKKTFPSLPAGFYDVFSERIKANNFCDAKLIDAVNYVIDNSTYPTPTIGQFISYDKKIKFYTYEEILKMVNELGDVWKNYAAIDLGLPKKVWFHVNDIAKYNL